MSPLNGIGEALQAAERIKPRLEKLKDATNGFESIFLKSMLTAMRRGMPKTDANNSFSGEMYRDMLDDALASQAGKAGTLGIGKLLYEKLAPMAVQQEQARIRLEAQARQKDNA